MEPKTVGHRAIVFAHRIADRADCGRLLVQADFGFGLTVMPMTIGADRTPECLAKFFWNCGSQSVKHASFLRTRRGFRARQPSESNVLSLYPIGRKAPRPLLRAWLGAVEPTDRGSAFADASESTSWRHRFCAVSCRWATRRLAGQPWRRVST